ncbi:interleukin-1 receptor-associated kinase 1-binding protein 1-like protein [Huso huso]|uniref:Interleukin-1 receptor-associated kinase 1-binding protein 1-like protein n=1 Tax=Huso huso TaxID=61971 RepID=A0ABR0ZW60_HUSHU
MAVNPSRVFAAVIPVGDVYRDENEGMIRTVRRNTEQTPTREVQVTGNAELSSGPNRARLCLQVSSRKDSVTEAKNSVSRRLDYILQSLRQQGVKEENVTVTKDIRRAENAYYMEAEVCVTFSDFVKMQNISNFLVEKLDSSVTVSAPQFYHTTENLESIRRQVCLVAVGNARHKAKEVCRLVGQSLGRPLVIKEEETKEWEGQSEETEDQSGGSSQPTVNQKIKNATVFVSSRVFASFEIKAKGKKNS